MATIADSKESRQPVGWDRLKASVRTRTSLWIGLAAIVGWLLSRVPPKRQRIYAHGSDRDTNQHSGKITLASKSKQPKSGRGLLALTLELLGAVAIRLMQRHLKAWSSTLIVALKSPEARSPRLFPAGLRQKIYINFPITDPKYHQRRLSRKSLTKKGLWRYSKTPPVSGSKTNVPNSVQLWPTSRFFR